MSPAVSRRFLAHAAGHVAGRAPGPELDAWRNAVSQGRALVLDRLPQGRIDLTRRSTPARHRP